MREIKENFETWLKELRDLLTNKYQFPTTADDDRYGTADDWKFYYETNHTPDEAITAEFKHL